MYFSIFKYSKYTFDDKKPYENVILLLYRHWFVITVQLVGLFVLLILPLILYVFINQYLNENLTGLLSFLYIIFLLFWWQVLFYRITMYLLDIWIVTDHRIIDSEQHGFFKRTVAELSLSKIQDISVEISGLIPTFLDYGNLEIQTAGTENKFMFKQIPHPNEVKDIIMNLHNEFLRIHKDGIEVHEGGGV